MRFAPRFLTVALLAIVGLIPTAPAAKADITIDMSRYAAVAYSMKTGKIGYAWDGDSREQVETVALSKCEADDAKIVSWVRGGWIALAIADDNSYGVSCQYGEGASLALAQERALAQCQKVKGSKNPAWVKLNLCSGDYAPKVYANPAPPKPVNSAGMAIALKAGQ